MGNEKKRAVGYVRVSTEEQAKEGLSLDAQEARIMEYAKEHGMEIGKIYHDEGVSGKIAINKRPAMMQLLKDAEKEEFDVILFIRLDRWFRSVANYYKAQEILDQHGILWATTNEEYELLTANGRLMVNIRLSVAAAESDATSERIKITFANMVKNNHPITGSLPIGFMIESDGKEKRVVHDPETEEAVKHYLDHFLKYGNKNRAMVATNEKYGTDYSYKYWRNMLASPLLYGTYRDNNGFCEPYIDKAAWDKIQAMSNRNVKAAPRATFLFSGLLRCPVCGWRLGGLHQPPRPKRKSSYYCYRCTNAIQNHRCTWTRNAGEKKIEKHLLAELDGYITKEIDRLTLTDAEDDGAQVEKKIKKLESERKRLTNVYVKGRISDKDYDSRYQELTDQIDRLKEIPTQKRSLGNLESLLKSDWRNLYDAMDREHKQGFWKQLLSDIVINEDREVTRLVFH